MSQYQAAYNYAEEAINQDECALQCALGCKKTCHSYVFEDDTCNFIKTDIQFKEPKPFVLLTGNLETTKVIKKLGRLSLTKNPFPSSLLISILVDRSSKRAEEALKMIPDDIKGEKDLVKMDKGIKKLTLNGLKDSETLFVFDNTDLKELNIIATPTLVSNVCHIFLYCLTFFLLLFRQVAKLRFCLGLMVLSSANSLYQSNQMHLLAWSSCQFFPSSIHKDQQKAHQR